MEETHKILLSEGEVVHLGRGFLGCKDKRLSRKQGQLVVTADLVDLKSLHYYGCYIRKHGAQETQKIKVNSIVQLSQGDRFACLPDGEWYELLKCPSRSGSGEGCWVVQLLADTDLNSTICLDNMTDKETDRKSPLFTNNIASPAWVPVKNEIHDHIIPHVDLSDAAVDNNHQGNSSKEQTNYTNGAIKVERDVSSPKDSGSADENMPIAQIVSKRKRCNSEQSNRKEISKKKKTENLYAQNKFLSLTPTTQQLYALLNFLDENRSLARGVLRDVAGRIKSRRLWEQITVTLNAMGGCVKTLQQWQKVWADKKYLAKKAVRSYNQMRNSGSPNTQLTPVELKIISILDDGSLREQSPTRSQSFYKFKVQPSHTFLLPQESDAPKGKRIRRIISSDETVKGRLFRMEARRLEQGERLISEISGLREDIKNVHNLLCQYLVNVHPK